MRVIGQADDFSDANGLTILTYDQAQAKARELMKRRTFAEAGIVEGPYTVARAIDDYVAFLDASGKDHKWAELRARNMIVPVLGNIEVAALTSDRLRKFLVDMADAPPRRRRHTSPRARKASANRTFSVLRAALNHAFDERRVASNDAWGRRVKPFKAVSSKRDRYLELDECQRLINACEGSFRDLVQAALLTGCRFGELIRLTASDVKHGGTVHVRKSKSGKERYVVLTDEGTEFFTRLAAGHTGDHRLLDWHQQAQRRALVAALERAHITPPITFHGLRHTYASHAIMNGVPLMVVAQNLGHADTRMVEYHYGHLAKSFVADAIRAGAPRFGLTPTNVEPYRGRGN
jgi:integrase